MNDLRRSFVWKLAQAPTSIGQWRRLTQEKNSPKSATVRGTGPAVWYQACFVQKITFVLRKINKNYCHKSCTFWLQYAPNRLSAGALPQTPLGELTALPRPLAVFWGPTSKGRGGRGREGEFVLCPRKEKEESTSMKAGTYDTECVVLRTSIVTEQVTQNSDWHSSGPRDCLVHLCASLTHC